MPADLDQVFKAYDVRGLYPEQLDEDLARSIGRAFIGLTGAGSLAIGQDMRPSSAPMADALGEGATSQGADVVRVGLCSTDMLYYVSGALDVAGIMLTASHNPSQYNGLKFCRPGAVPVGQDSGLAELKRMVAGGEPAGEARRRGSVHQGEDLLARYAEHVRGFVDKGALRPLTVVADAGNGMAGHVLPAIFERLPFELVPMYFELDGTFPNHPADPINPENLKDLRKRVVAEGADVGLAFDGDADRVFLVDERGGIVQSSLVCALVARTMCEREPGATVLYNLISASTRVTTTSATTTAPTPGSWPRWWCSRSSRARTGRCPRSSPRTGATRTPARSTAASRTGTWSRSSTGWRSATLPPPATGPTGSPSTLPSGGSTCVRATPSRCCA